MRYNLAAKSVAICSASMSLWIQDAWALETIEEPEFEMLENFAEQAEYENGVTQKYNTMNFIIFQSFFDKLSSDFIPGFLSGLTNATNVNNVVHVESASIDPNTPLATINDGNTTFAFKNLNMNVTADFGSEDMGEGSINIEDLSMSVVVTTSTEPFQV